MTDKKAKYDRIIYIYSELTAGKTISKPNLAMKFGVNERTIQRDIDDIRAFFADNTLGIGHGKTVVFDRVQNGYRMEDADSEIFTNSEILAVCKILLESRSLVRDEMMPIIDKLLQRCVPEKNKKKVLELIGNEKFHYCEPHHGVKFVSKLWDLGTAIQEHRYIDIEYMRMKKPNETKCDIVTRRLKPVGIMVSEFYFYLTAFIDGIDRQEHFEDPNDLSPTIYRIDRIQKLTVTQKNFYVPYRDRFEEGEFRKRVQFMYGGRLRKIRFKYTGYSPEAILDRIPMAKIIKQKDGQYTFEAEVFGKGIDMWLRSQGDLVEYIEGKEGYND